MNTGVEIGNRMNIGVRGSAVGTMEGQCVSHCVCFQVEECFSLTRRRKF